MTDATETTPQVLSEEQVARTLDALWDYATVVGHAYYQKAIKQHLHSVKSHIEALTAERDALRAKLEERQDWTPDDVTEAVDRVREAAQEDAIGIMVSTDDLRKLFASADGVADSYSTLLEHVTGLTKPTTDPRRACTLADDKESERAQEYAEEYAQEIVTERDAALAEVERLRTDTRALTAERDQQAWDMRSLEATVENLRAEVGRLREALEWYAAHGGERARAVLGMGVE